MKKLLLWAVALMVAVAAVLWIGSGFVGRMYEKREWAGLGTLNDVPKRFPPTVQNAAATRLVALTAPARIDLKPKQHAFAAQQPPRDRVLMTIRDELAEYVKKQSQRSGDTIDPLPPAVEQYLSENASALDAARDHLLSGQRVVWESDITKGASMPLPNLLGHMHLQRALTVRAYEKARLEDSTAWNELRASWELNRGLWNRPDLISMLIALATTRMTNAAARKMPLPAPEWLDEMFSFDSVGAFARSLQAEAWFIRNAIPTGEGSPRFLRPLAGVHNALVGARAAETMRRFVEQAVQANVCDVDSSQFAVARATAAPTWLDMAMPNILEGWRRAMRFRAEREATQRVLQVRNGEAPNTKSQCADGAWTVTPTGFKFSSDPAVSEMGIRYPLEYSR